MSIALKLGLGVQELELDLDLYKSKHIVATMADSSSSS